MRKKLMTDPVIAQYKPYHVDAEEGKTYLWCSCGLSKTQPFCDRSHVGTDFKPVVFRAEKSQSVLLCGCKHTKDQPFCDGSHNDLTDDYIEDDRPREELLAATTLVAADSHGRVMLEGGCFVQKIAGLKFKNTAGLNIAPIVTEAEFMAHFYFKMPQQEDSEALLYRESDVVLYILSGHGSVTISGKVFKAEPSVGIYVRMGEAFSIQNTHTEELVGLITVCPTRVEPEILDSMSQTFDTKLPQRTVAYNKENRNVMANRFYQVLVGEEIGSHEVSQFVGEIPRSKAAPHRHLYEEVICILTGSGLMWTETKRGEVASGDLIVLPAKQTHSLECTVDSGMTLVGHFYPSGSPTINY